MKSSRGFTLVELLITVAMLAIIVSVGVPAMSNFIINQRVQAQATALQATLQFARTEASSKNRIIKVIPRVNSSEGWASGWCVVTSDINNCNGTVIRGGCRS
ncbi:MAG TPA: GspH/FimT family pseudopilin [Pseudomonas sp.]|nr:GspH/FimT family pseudopilin [Pseudomonas sp.]